METYEETEWSAASNLENNLQALESQISQEFRDRVDSESSDAEALECVVCEKVFRTERALINHEKSRKHREAVAALKQEMLADDKEIELLDVAVSEEDAETATPMKLSKKQKKKRKQQQKETREKEQEVIKTSQEVNDDLAERLAATNLDTSDTAESNVNVDKEALENGNKTPEQQPSDDEFVHKSANKNKKKNKKNAKVLETKTAAIIDKPDPLTCTICKEKLDSRNKLFQHIQETGHVAIKLATGQVTEDIVAGDKKKKRGKR